MEGKTMREIDLSLSYLFTQEIIKKDELIYRERKNEIFISICALEEDLFLCRSLFNNKM